MNLWPQNLTCCRGHDDWPGNSLQKQQGSQAPHREDHTPVYVLCPSETKSSSPVTVRDLGGALSLIFICGVLGCMYHPCWSNRGIVDRNVPFGPGRIPKAKAAGYHAMNTGLAIRRLSFILLPLCCKSWSRSRSPILEEETETLVDLSQITHWVVMSFKKYMCW